MDAKKQIQMALVGAIMIVGLSSCLKEYVSSDDNAQEQKEEKFVIEAEKGSFVMNRTANDGNATLYFFADVETRAVERDTIYQKEAIKIDNEDGTFSYKAELNDKDIEAINDAVKELEATGKACKNVYAKMDCYEEETGKLLEATEPILIELELLKPSCTQYIVTFDVRGKGIKPASIKVNGGELVTKPTDPVERGWCFLGWYKESDGNNMWDFANDRVVGDVILYAKWQVDTFPTTSPRTVFVYMAGDNSLGDLQKGISCINENLNMMYEGMEKTSFENRLLCFVDYLGKENSSVLYEINPNSRSPLKELVDYKENLNSADPDVFRRVFEDVKKFAKNDHYGCILWSHGSGWLPFINLSETRAFVQDATSDNDFMDLQELKKAFEGYHFDFVLCDVCYMASVEFYYALRNNVDYFLAHPTETWGNGYPYHTMTPYFFSSADTLESSLKTMLDLYTNYYGKYTYTVSLVSTKHLGELADTLSKLNVDLSSVDKEKVQQFRAKGDGGKYLDVPIYDFGDVYKQALGEEIYNKSVKGVLNKIVLEEKHTSAFNGWKITSCCGLTSYLPEASRTNTNPAYEETDWYIDTHKEYVGE